MIIYVTNVINNLLLLCNDIILDSIVLHLVKTLFGQWRKLVSHSKMFEVTAKRTV